MKFNSIQIHCCFTLLGDLLLFLTSLQLVECRFGIGPDPVANGLNASTFIELSSTDMSSAAYTSAMLSRSALIMQFTKCVASFCGWAATSHHILELGLQDVYDCGCHHTSWSAAEQALHWSHASWWASSLAESHLGVLEAECQTCTGQHVRHSRHSLSWNQTPESSTPCFPRVFTQGKTSMPPLVLENDTSKGCDDPTGVALPVAPDSQDMRSDAQKLAPQPARWPQQNGIWFRIPQASQNRHAV